MDHILSTQSAVEGQLGCCPFGAVVKGSGVSVHFCFGASFQCPWVGARRGVAGSHDSCVEHLEGGPDCFPETTHHPILLPSQQSGFCSGISLLNLALLGQWGRGNSVVWICISLTPDDLGHLYIAFDKMAVQVPCFLIGSFAFLLLSSKCSLYILDRSLYQRWDLQIFSPTLGLSFHFHDSVLQNTKVFCRLFFFIYLVICFGLVWFWVG